MSLKNVTIKRKLETKNSLCRYRAAEFCRTYETRSLMVDGLLSEQLYFEFQ